MKLKVYLSEEAIKQQFIVNSEIMEEKVIYVNLSALSKEEREILYNHIDIDALKTDKVSKINKRSIRGGYVNGSFNSFDIKAIIAEIKEAEEAYQKNKNEEEALKKEVETFRKHLKTFKDLEINLDGNDKDGYALTFIKEDKGMTFAEAVNFDNSLDDLKKSLPEIKAKALTEIERRAQNEAQIAENREAMKAWGELYGSELLKKRIKYGYDYEHLAEKEFKEAIYPRFFANYRVSKKDTPTLEELEKLEGCIKDHPNAYIDKDGDIAYKFLLEYPIGGKTYRKELYVFV